jgi:hypothetical protein
LDGAGNIGGKTEHETTSGKNCKDNIPEPHYNLLRLETDGARVSKKGNPVKRFLNHLSLAR